MVVSSLFPYMYNNGAGNVSALCPYQKPTLSKHPNAMATRGK